MEIMNNPNPAGEEEYKKMVEMSDAELAELRRRILEQICEINDLLIRFFSTIDL